MNDTEMRPCLIGKDFDQKALFHRWVDLSQIVPPSLMAGGHGGGVVKDVCALVETEDGTMKRVDVRCIRFIDSCAKINGYKFPEDDEHG